MLYSTKPLNGDHYQKCMIAETSYEHEVHADSYEHLLHQKICPLRPQI